MIHIIYFSVIIYALLVGLYWDNDYCLKTNLLKAFLLLFFPILFLYILFYKIYKNDYVFFIRVLYFNFKVKNVERLIYNINCRRKRRSELWNKLADKVILKIS